MGAVGQFDILILTNRGLVYRIVAKYRRPGVLKDDLVQEGMVGLVRAAQSYEPARGRFSTHAYYLIWGAITTYYRHEVYHLGSEERRRGERAYMAREPNERQKSGGSDGHYDRLLDAIPDTAPLPDEVTEERRCLSRLRDALRRAAERILHDETQPDSTRRAAANLLCRRPVSVRRLEVDLGITKRAAMMAQKSLFSAARSLV